MAFIDDMAICPFYIKIRKRRITCESLCDDATNELKFADDGKALEHFGKYCRTFGYNGCPYAQRLDEKYENDN